MMKVIVFTAAFVLASGSAYAASCKAEAGSKKLAGAAETSFMKKCETDAKKACTDKATAAKLSGAAKDSNVAKCVKDSVGT